MALETRGKVIEHVKRLVDGKACPLQGREGHKLRHQAMHIGWRRAAPQEVKHRTRGQHPLPSINVPM